MAASKAFSTKGTTMAREEMPDSSGANFVIFGEITNIAPSAATRTIIDVTHLNSGAWKEFIASGFIDAGEYVMTCNLIEADYLLLLTDMANSASSVNWQLVFPNTEATQVDFAAWISSVSVGSVGIDAKAECTFTLKIDGEPVHS